MIFAKLFRRRPDWWARPGAAYACNPKCGYLFSIRYGAWHYNPDPSDHPDRWRKVGARGAWEELEEDFADCSGSLERRYAGSAPAINRTRARWYRGRFVCFCDDLSQHVHWRGKRYFG